MTSIRAIFHRLLYLIARAMTLASGGRDVPDTDQEDVPSIRRQEGFDAPTAHITIHSTDALREKNGRWPEQRASQLLADAFDEVGLDYEIAWGYDETVDVPTEDPYEDDFATVWHWYEMTPLHANADAYLLLTAADGGGVNVGDSCIAGAGNIDHTTEVTATSTAGDFENFHAIGHEVGHALGVGPDADPDEPGQQTYGFSWIENGHWHRTFVVSTDEEDENACGEAIEPNDDDLPVVYHNYYHWCSAEEIRRTLRDRQ